MNTAATPAGSAGRRTPAPRAPQIVPCQVAPKLFELSNDTVRRQITAALWLCDTRCPEFAICLQRTPVPRTIMAGRLIDRYGRAYSDVAAFFGRPAATDNEKAAATENHRLCGMCAGLMPDELSPQARFCSAKCREERRTQKRGPRLATHCGHGHEYTDANTGLRINGKRFCLECRYGDSCVICQANRARAKERAAA